MHTHFCIFHVQANIRRKYQPGSAKCGQVTMEHATIGPNDGHPIPTVYHHHSKSRISVQDHMAPTLTNVIPPSQRPRSRQIRTPLSVQCSSHPHVE
eukprot:6214255-Pleurochrysis_carterae.AAC.1